MGKKRLVALFLTLMLLLGLMGCQGGSELLGKQTSEDYDLSYQTGFRDKNYPEGGMTKDQIAFARNTGSGYTVENLPRTELEQYENDGYLPRYSFFEGSYPAELELLVHCLVYAQKNHYERFILPMEQSFLDALREADRSFWWSMDVNCTSNESNSTELPDGTRLFYCLYVLTPYYLGDYATWNEQQDAAFAAAKEVVAGIPAGASEYDTVLYLYRYLTEHVQYAYDNYYPGDTDYYDYMVNLYYDTLVDGLTVCAGYGRTFAWLCELAGIEAFPVAGQATETESHMWTIAKIDGEYYWFDPTWDEGIQAPYYAYFGISDAEMEEWGFRHLFQAYEEILPACPNSLPLPEDTQGLRVYRSETYGFVVTPPDGWRIVDPAQYEDLAYSAYDPHAAKQIALYTGELEADEIAASEDEYVDGWLAALAGDNPDGVQKQQIDFLGSLQWVLLLEDAETQTVHAVVMLRNGVESLDIQATADTAEAALELLKACITPLPAE